MSLTTVSGERYWCMGSGKVNIQLLSGVTVTVSALVVSSKPLDCDFILGMNGVKALKGVTVNSPNDVRFGVENKNELMAAMVQSEQVEVEEKDFKVSYSAETKKWTVTWKWGVDAGTPLLRNSVTEYHVPPSARPDYEKELCQWINDEWLVPYDVKLHGPVKGTIPLMAVTQHNKNKVRPVFDFRELNSYLDAHTAEADVCADKVREWRKRGQQVALLDLRKAYLQIHVHPSLWAYQTVVFRGKRYCLTRLGFGLNIAPLVLKKVLSTVLCWDTRIKQATSPYLDDILVDERVATATDVQNHLHRHGIVSKPAERVKKGARVLGMKVWEEQSCLVWKRDNSVCDLPEKLTRRTVFSLCGQLIGHLPVAGWLRPAASYLKRRVNALSSSWDEEVTDPTLRKILEETMAKVKSCDPARGRWDVDGDKATLWVDASTLALGAVLEVNGDVIEDACWLRRDECAHINLAELDAVVKGLNIAMCWKIKKLTLKTDSRTVYHWVVDTLSGRARVRTKAASEMLIRRRLETIKSIMDEYELLIDVVFVLSAENKADALTRVPKRWLGPDNEDVEVCGAGDAMMSDQDIARIHATSGHPGIRRTLYFCKRVAPAVRRRDVRSVVLGCRECQSIDPAPERWEKGNIGVSDTWGRISMDVCHVGNSHYLTLIDCGPTRYAIWRRIRRQDTASVVEQLESVFFERGAPKELLTDNAASFRSSEFEQFAIRWGVRVRYRCAHVPSGNGISERCHRTIKTILARSGCSVAEAVYRYNTMPQGSDASSAPANKIFRYEVRLRGIDRVEEHDQSTEFPQRFSIGDRVWILHPSRRCDARSSLGTITRITSAQNVEVDGMPRHVRDLRLARSEPAIAQEPAVRDEMNDNDDDGMVIYVQNPERGQVRDFHSSNSEEEGSPGRELPRRGSRVRRQTRPYQYGDPP